MKKVIFFVLLPIAVRAQKIEENKIDEFTKHHILRTSWEFLSHAGGFYTHVRISNIEKTYYLDFKWIHDGEVDAIPEGSKMMLKMDNDSIVTLTTLQSAVSCRGCGAVGFAGSTGYGYELTFVIDEKALDELDRSTIKKIRIYTPDGYVEHEIKGKNSSLVVNELALIHNSLASNK